MDCPLVGKIDKKKFEIRGAEMETGGWLVPTARSLLFYDSSLVL